MDWWIGGLVDWWIGGLVDWWIGGLVDWWIGGLVDWWIGGLKRRTAQGGAFAIQQSNLSADRFHCCRSFTALHINRS